MLHLLLAALIALAVRPGVCQAPCDIRLTLRVEQERDNAYVLLEIKGTNYSRTSYIDYSNGGPRTTEIWYKSLPAGEYEILATLHKHDGKSWVAGTAKSRITVSGGLTDPE